MWEDERGNKRLVGYVVRRGEERLDQEEMRKELRRRLPEHMVPVKYVELKQMPMTSNGKLDRGRLPKQEEQEREGKEEEKTAIEEIVSGIWGEVLGVKKIGIHENFFELGGHSLLATQVVSRVREVMGVEIELKEVFERPTVRGMAEAVEAEGKAGANQQIEAPIRPVSREQELPLSFAQQRLWIIHQLEPGKGLYNIPRVVRLIGELDIDVMRRALEQIIKRHEVLRTRFESRPSGLVQVIEPPCEVDLEIWDVRERQDRQERASEIAHEIAAQPFDLHRGPLWRAALVRLGEEDHKLVLNMRSCDQ